MCGSPGTLSCYTFWLVKDMRQPGNITLLHVLIGQQYAAAREHYPAAYFDWSTICGSLGTLSCYTFWLVNNMRQPGNIILLHILIGQQYAAAREHYPATRFDWSTICSSPGTLSCCMFWLVKNTRQPGNIILLHVLIVLLRLKHCSIELCLIN